MKVLITGIEGFVGGHLARFIRDQGDIQLFGTTFFPVERSPHLVELGVHLEQVDLIDEDHVHRLLETIRPDQVYHLAAQSFVPESFANPWGTLSNNIHAQLNLLHSMYRLDLDARILIVGSGEQYGPVTPDEVPINEDQPLRPASPYSVSKVAQDMLGLQYFLSHGVSAIRVRPFNQIGPGQSSLFVAAAFASQIAAIELGKKEPVVHVGSLEARRDFTDVRDMVRAYWLVMAHGKPGDVYNVGSGQAHSIRELLDTLLEMSAVRIDVAVDPTRLRPVEVPIVVCDYSKIRASTGWEPAYSFRQTLADVLEDWRERIRQQP